MRPVICPRAREQAPCLKHTFADATHSATLPQGNYAISLFKSSTGVEMRHHVDNVLPSECWNKAWLEQNLEQVLLSKIKELGGFVPVFQCSDQKSRVWESENKLAKSFVLFSECKTFFAKTPSILRTPRTLEQSVLSPLLLLLYYIYYIYKSKTYRIYSSHKKPCSSSISKVIPIRTSEHEQYQILTQPKTGL